MVENEIIDTVRKYLARVAESGITVESGVLFGSFARGEQTPNSDIDLLVVSPDFDGRFEHKLVDLLWSLRRFVDSRIEPHAVGVRQFEKDNSSPLIGIARRDGLVVPFAAHSAVAEERAEYGKNHESGRRQDQDDCGKC